MSIQRLTREDFRRKRELDELRKAGAAPAEVDDEGNMINPHIPKYMADAPWYVSDGRPGLKHLKNSKTQKFANFSEFSRKGFKVRKNKIFRPGACKNCGATTHSEKHCCERPRKLKAVWSHKDIQPDELIPKDYKYDYDGKRDNWKSFDLDEQKKLIQYSEKLSEARKFKRNKELDQMFKDGKLFKSELEKSDDDADITKDSGQVIQAMNDKKRQTIRNLRTREDTAKYLHNLDVNSAFYDPKTRSMRSNPNAAENKNKSNFLGDNFHRISGDATKFQKQQILSNQIDQIGLEFLKGAAQMSSNPTKSEKIVDSFVNQKETKKKQKQSQLIDNYGGEAHLKSRPLLIETESYEVFNKSGCPIDRRNETHVITKYQEDVVECGHSEIWGSFYDISSQKWGYMCCCSLKRGVDCKAMGNKLI